MKSKSETGSEKRSGSVWLRAWRVSYLTTVDPHQGGPWGPLWDKGTNIITTGSDIDVNGVRISGVTADIGADEWNGVDTWFTGVPRIGSTLYVGASGTRSNPLFLALSAGSMPPVSIQGFGGTFELDLTQPNLITTLTTDSRGLARGAFPVPNLTPLAGLEIFIQCLDAGSTTFSDLDRIAFVR